MSNSDGIAYRLNGNTTKPSPISSAARMPWRCNRTAYIGPNNAGTVKSSRTTSDTAYGKLDGAIAPMSRHTLESATLQANP